MYSKKTISKPFLIISVVLILFGIIVFISASLGLLASDGASISRVITKQFIALGIGLVLFYLGLKIKYTFWKKYSFYIFILSVITTLLVFIPGIGKTLGGATRWIEIGSLTVQPAEFLKFGFILYFAAWLSSIRSKVDTFKYGLFPMGLVLAVIAMILLAQPNTGILIIISLTAVSMFFVAGAKWKHLVLLILIALLGLFVLSLYRPYVKDRFITFFNPADVDSQAEGYQIKQSLIAVGSGGVFGKGIGQSVQKFNFLPEPIGDSIFAVLAEEFGFIGGTITIFLFLLVSILGLKIAARAPDTFSRLLTVGVVILITVQSYLNIGAMLGVFPLSGIPILFISQGGSALMFALLEIGIILNISKYEIN